MIIDMIVKPFQDGLNEQQLELRFIDDTLLHTARKSKKGMKEEERKLWSRDSDLFPGSFRSLFSCAEIV